MAVKVVQKQRPSLAIDERLLRREVEIGRRVSESGADMLLSVVDAAETNEALFLVMVRADGALDDMARPMAELEATSVMTEVAAGLQQLHTIGIIHRDLKPANVLRHDGRWKLADFGIARDEEIGTQDPTFRGAGTLAYMAPELFELKSPTVKTDLYALGCVGFELLTGAPPYTGDFTTIRAGHLFEIIPHLPCSNIALRNLIIRLLAKDPGDRPQDARAVLERLQRVFLPRSSVQEAIVRGLGDHADEKSRSAVAEATARAERKEREDRIAQARADLREIVQDAYEDLQAIAPEAALKERQPASPPQPDFDRLEFDKQSGFTLSTDDATLRIDVWEQFPVFARSNMLAKSEDTLIRAGCVVIKNRRFFFTVRNVANLVYEQVGGRLTWRMYRFHGPKGGDGVDYYGPPDIAHGLVWKDFFGSRWQASGFPTWSNTVTEFGFEVLLGLFQEAVDLKGPRRNGNEISLATLSSPIAQCD